MKMPSEEVLQDIEFRHNISIERNHYASREYYNCNHPEGKLTPVFSANNGLGDGKHVSLVSIDHRVYVVDHTGNPVKEPIPILRAGRNA